MKREMFYVDKLPTSMMFSNANVFVSFPFFANLIPFIFLYPNFFYNNDRGHCIHVFSSWNGFLSIFVIPFRRIMVLEKMEFPTLMVPVIPGKQHNFTSILLY